MTISGHPFPLSSRRLGTTDLWVSPICVGAGALGGVPGSDWSVTESAAAALMEEFLSGPLNFLDTSNEYGHGESERRIGEALSRFGGLPSGKVVATKVDPVPGTNDFSGSRVRASVEESLGRLGLDHLPLVYFHDPQRIPFDDAMATGGPVEALLALREAGVVKHIGLAGGHPGLQRRYLATGAFEVVVSHNRYTLVDQTADSVMSDAVERRIGFVNAAAFGGGRGMLARGQGLVRDYGYRQADSALLARVRDIEELCRHFDVPIAALALQFSLREQRIASTIVGMTTPGRIGETVRLAGLPIPQELWQAVGRLVPTPRIG